jgi:hypothetical protein
MVHTKKEIELKWGSLAADLFTAAWRKTLSISDVVHAREAYLWEQKSSVVRLVAAINIDDPNKTNTIAGMQVKVPYCQPLLDCDEVVRLGMFDMGWDNLDDGFDGGLQ